MSIKTWLYNMTHKKEDEPIPSSVNFVTPFDFQTQVDEMIIRLGYKKIEETPELVAYTKDDGVYGRKHIDIYLSSDCVPLIRCYEAVSGEAMSMTLTEVTYFTYKLNAMITKYEWPYCLY